jgi:hypothetical protein
MLVPRTVVVVILACGFGRMDAGVADGCGIEAARREGSPSGFPRGPAIAPAPRFVVDRRASMSIDDGQGAPEGQHGPTRDGESGFGERQVEAPPVRRDMRPDPEGDDRAASAEDRRTPAESVPLVFPRADCGCSGPGSSTAMEGRPLTVHLVDSTGLPQESREAVAAEVVRFWADHQVGSGGSAADSSGSRESAGDARTVYVLLRPGAAPARAGAPRRRSGPSDDAALAWTPFHGDRAGSVLFVWVGAVQRLLDASRIEGRPFTHWHPTLRRALLARALGRVAAHEIGHLVCGRPHASGGLMKRRFTADDLLWNTTRLATDRTRQPCLPATP